MERTQADESLQEAESPEFVAPGWHKVGTEDLWPFSRIIDTASDRFCSRTTPEGDGKAI